MVCWPIRGVIRAIASFGNAHDTAGFGFVEMNVDFDCFDLAIAFEDRLPYDDRNEAADATVGKTAGQDRSSHRDNCIADADRDDAIGHEAAPVEVDLGRERIFDSGYVAAN